MRFVLFAFLVSIFSCSEYSSNENYFQLDFDDQLKQIANGDSIPLFDSVNYFNYSVNIEKISANVIVAAQIPGLSFSLLDGNGIVKKKFTQKGNAPGMLGNSNFALSAIGDSGNIYILTSGNAYRLLVFDPDGEYIHSYKLFESLIQISVPSARNSLIVREKPNGETLLSFGTNSTLYSYDSKEFLQECYGVAQFVINQNERSIVSFSQKVRLFELDEVKNAFNNEYIHWAQPNPMFDFEDGKFYLVFPFSQNVRVYDESFNLMDSIPIKKLEELDEIKYYHSDLNNNYDFYDRTVVNERLRMENINITNINIRNGQLLLQFPQVFKEGSYPLIKREDLGIIRPLPYYFHQHLIIKNLSNSEEKFITLPENTFEAKLKDNNSVRASHVCKDIEAKYLIEYSWR